MNRGLSREELAIVKKAVCIWQDAVRNSGGLQCSTKRDYCKHARRMMSWFEGTYDLPPTRGGT